MDWVCPARRRNNAEDLPQRCIGRRGPPPSQGAQPMPS